MERTRFKKFARWLDKLIGIVLRFQTKRVSQNTYIILHSRKKKFLNYSLHLAAFQLILVGIVMSTVDFFFPS